MKNTVLTYKITTSKKRSQKEIGKDKRQEKGSQEVSRRFEKGGLVNGQVENWAWLNEVSNGL